MIYKLCIFRVDSSPFLSHYYLIPSPNTLVLKPSSYYTSCVDPSPNRVLSLVIVIAVLWSFHDSFFMVLMCCSCLNAVAVYIQFQVTQVQRKSTLHAIATVPIENNRKCQMRIEYEVVYYSHFNGISRCLVVSGGVKGRWGERRFRRISY